MSNKSANASVEAAIARLASRQHGVVSLAQLNAAGLHRSVIVRRTRKGLFHRIHRGVYAVGHAGLSNEGRWMAAVLACGEGAVLSHRSAAALWTIAPLPSVIEVMVHGDAGRRPRNGIRIHRSLTLLPSQTTRRAGIPVTKPSRTLEDLKRALPSDQFAAALRQAEFLRLPIGEQLEPDHTRSELESRFLALCRRHRLPKPEANVRVGPFLVDFLWRSRRLVIEVDGFGTHGTRFAFEADRARDTRLKLMGYDVVRFTWRQIGDGASAVAATLRTLLG
ncbi:MAG: type IV toxin-antitoxin system AbiEi family antitoxin domain-containing protein [Actinomycetota bacterium]